MPTDELMSRILEDAVRKAGLWSADQDIRFPLITKSGINDQGRTVRYYLNYSARPVAFRYPHAAGRDLLANQAVATGAELQVPGWGVRIVLEDR
jgi:beta-galactosidase